jgi:hypothetical protein
MLGMYGMLLIFICFSMYATLLANIPIVFITLLCGPKATRYSNNKILLTLESDGKISMVYFAVWHALRSVVLLQSRVLPKKSILQHIWCSV